MLEAKVGAFMILSFPQFATVIPDFYLDYILNSYATCYARSYMYEFICTTTYVRMYATCCNFP